MNGLIAFVKRNPARVSHGIIAAVGLLTAFGLNLSADQVGAITSFTAIVLSEPVRRSVTPKVSK